MRAPTQIKGRLMPTSTHNPKSPAPDPPRRNLGGGGDPTIPGQRARTVQPAGENPLAAPRVAGRSPVARTRPAGAIDPDHRMLVIGTCPPSPATLTNAGVSCGRCMRRSRTPRHCGAASPCTQCTHRAGRRRDCNGNKTAAGQPPCCPAAATSALPCRATCPPSWCPRRSRRPASPPRYTPTPTPLGPARRSARRTESTAGI
jgi:hypothetical protein